MQNLEFGILNVESGMKVIDCGLKKYVEVLKLQEELFNQNIADKLNGKPTQNYLLLCEHLPVFTLGKSGKRENILVNDDELQADFHKINRGGDITFHGPGQLVVYPILDLDTFHLGLAKYIYQLEEVIILSLVPFGLKGERIEDAAGIWLRDDKGDRKICAFGIQSSRNITMHGLAMNVNTDLSYFHKIVPCGLKDKGVTSLEKEIGKKVDFNSYKNLFVAKFEEVFGCIKAMSPEL
jgi:lipoyl(octanoyl) transferase